ncbi:MAG: response regulator transcription factor [Sphingomicrobium sp.]
MVSRNRVAVVAEAEDFYSAGLAAVLKHQVGFATVLRARNVDQLLAIAAKSSLDLVTIGDDLPGSNGAQTIGELHSQYPDLRMAVFSRSSDVREILSLLAAGAHGVISKQTFDCAELLCALRTISEGGVFVPPMVELDNLEFGGRGGPLTGLTERQQQVIKLLSEGHPNKVIARKLGISPSTVKVHVHAAFRALGVHSRLAAVAAFRPSPLMAASRR